MAPERNLWYSSPDFKAVSKAFSSEITALLFMLHMALMLCLFSLSPRKITLGFGSEAKNETNCQLPEVESSGDLAKMLMPTMEPFESRDSGELPGRKIGLMISKL